MKKELKEFSKQLAEASEDLIRDYYFKQNFKIESKSDASPVTEADRKAELLMREMIKKKFPQHGIIGEEFGGKPGEQVHQWVIDPIDGTKSFIHGVPLFGTLLALLEDTKPIMGLMSLPALNSTMWAIKGQGRRSP